MALIDKITESVIKVPLEATTKTDVLRELVDILVRNGSITDGAAAYNALLERESRGSTGLENGIAVPHAKTDVSDEIAIAIGIAPDGIDFQALDGQKSTAFFLILAAPDQSGSHIEALSEIARMTRSAAFMRALVASRDAREIVELIRE